MTKRKGEVSAKSLKDSEKDEDEAAGSPPTKIAPIFLDPTRKSHGTWKVLPGQLMVYTSQGIEHRPKIAGFDLDGTLIKTKSGKVFPVDSADWQFWSRNVVAKLRKCHEQQQYKLIIFTNQMGIEKKHVDIGEFRQKVQSICTAIGLPIQVFISIGTLNYRKPYIGMWKRLEEAENDAVQIDRAQCLYVGDAAGRIKSNKRPKADHSCADRLFALNLGLGRFLTPEQFFEDKAEEEPFRLPEFNPAKLLDNHKQFDPADAQVPGPSQPELFVSVGPPACGKSTFARGKLAPNGCRILSQDELGSWKACLDGAREALTQGRSAVIDNTNRDAATRQRYCELATSLGVPCRCLLFDCSMANALHNNVYRKIVDDGKQADKAHQNVNELAIRMFLSKYEEPQLEEGFVDIVRVRFVPDFKDEEQRRIYGLYLTEKVT